MRDKTYPSEIAAERPIGKTRIHCPDDDSEQRMNRGSSSANRVDEFNDGLRSGHGWRNSGDE